MANLTVVLKFSKFKITNKVIKLEKKDNYEIGIVKDGSKFSVIKVIGDYLSQILTVEDEDVAYDTFDQIVTEIDNEKKLALKYRF